MVDVETADGGELQTASHHASRNWRVAMAVALALLAASSIASLIALALPWLIQRLGKDPAFGSGPLATVVQDVLTVAIYLAIATVIVL